MSLYVQRGYRFNRGVANLCKRQPITEEQLHHWKSIKSFRAILARVYEKADLGPTFVDSRRKLGYDSYLSLFLLGLYNPVVNSMRGLCGASHLPRVQEVIGGPAVSLGSFSEMQSVLEPELLYSLFVDLAEQIKAQGCEDPRLARLDLVAQDGSLWRALPRMGWAEYGVGPTGEAKGVRLHLRFHLVRNVPCDARVSAGRGCERQALRQMLKAGQINVGDRLYGKDYRLFGEVAEAKAFFVFRLNSDTVIHEQQSLPIDGQDRACGVVRHAWVSLGAHEDKRSIRLRLVEIRNSNHHLLLATNLPVEQATAELVGVIYRRRWQIELFFRWIKCILGNRHFLAESPRGVAIQLYLALIASLLLQLYTQRRPNKRQLEAIQFYMMGWASEGELLQMLKRAEPKKA